MIEYGKALAIGNGSPLKSDVSVLDNGKEIGRIYFMPLSFNAGFPYGVTINHIDCGFFSSQDNAKLYCETGAPEPKKFY